MDVFIILLTQKHCTHSNLCKLILRKVCFVFFLHIPLTDYVDSVYERDTTCKQRKTECKNKHMRFVKDDFLCLTGTKERCGGERREKTQLQG